MITWTPPQPLTAYHTAFRQKGIYIIGGRYNPNLSVTPGLGDDDYWGRNWPNNFKPYYVGISESLSSGVRGRLSRHSRKRGNMKISQRIRNNEPLFFIAAYGNDLAAYEALFLCLKTDVQFSDNIRSEIERGTKREYERVRANMTQYERDYYDNLDHDGRDG